MTEPQRVIMPFGKYKGEFLGDIPKTYLIWLLENTDLRPQLKTAVEQVISMLERSGE